MNSKILLAGIGGQGVLFAHQLLAECAIAQGLNVTGAETHGMSQRGGSVVSHLKIGDSQAPLIRQSTADFLLAFDPSESYRTISFIRRGGTVVVNNSFSDFPPPRLLEQLASMSVSLRIVDANAIARALGRISAANVALIGFASTCEGFPLATEMLKQTIARVAPERYRELNLNAFEEGVTAGTVRYEAI
jgi:indolepyruvate ferredoxin oxidoreductase beta subunit